MMMLSDGRTECLTNIVRIRRTLYVTEITIVHESLKLSETNPFNEAAS